MFAVRGARSLTTVLSVNISTVILGQRIAPAAYDMHRSRTEPRKTRARTASSETVGRPAENQAGYAIRRAQRPPGCVHWQGMAIVSHSFSESQSIACQLCSSVLTFHPMEADKCYPQCDKNDLHDVVWPVWEAALIASGVSELDLACLSTFYCLKLDYGLHMPLASLVFSRSYTRTIVVNVNVSSI